MAKTSKPNSSEELKRYVEANISTDRASDIIAQKTSKAMLKTMKELIALWVDTDVKEGKQRTLVDHEGYRIDQQKNNGFDKTITDGGRTDKQRYTLLAVQGNSSVFANVLLPMGEIIGESMIRRALYESLESGKLATLLPAPERLQLRNKYILVVDGKICEHGNM